MSSGGTPAMIAQVDWVSLGQTFGVSLLILAVFAWAVWKGLGYLAREVALPMFAEYRAVVEDLRQQLPLVVASVQKLAENAETATAVAAEANRALAGITHAQGEQTAAITRLQGEQTAAIVREIAALTAANRADNQALAALLQQHDDHVRANLPAHGHGRPPKGGQAE